MHFGSRGSTTIRILSNWLSFSTVWAGSADDIRTVGIAQGQFPVPGCTGELSQKEAEGDRIRTNKIYPLGGTGMSVVFLDESTMIFWQPACCQADPGCARWPGAGAAQQWPGDWSPAFRGHRASVECSRPERNPDYDETGPGRGRHSPDFDTVQEGGWWEAPTR